MKFGGKIKGVEDLDAVGPGIGNKEPGICPARCRRHGQCPRVNQHPFTDHCAVTAPQPPDSDHTCSGVSCKENHGLLMRRDVHRTSFDAQVLKDQSQHVNHVVLVVPTPMAASLGSEPCMVCHHKGELHVARQPTRHS